MNRIIYNNGKIGMMEMFIPLFCIINQYKIFGIQIGLVAVIFITAFSILTNRNIYVYKPLFALFGFMLVHDVIKMFIVGINFGLWAERLCYLLLLSCIYKRVDEEKLFNIWKYIAIIVMVGMFIQSFQVYILGESVSTIRLIPLMKSGSSNYLLKYNRPHSFFFEPASYSTWMLPFLCMCMKKKKNIWLIVGSISVLLSTSSTGILLTGILWLFYSINMAISERKRSNSIMILGILLIGVGVFCYVPIFAVAVNKLTKISITDTSNSVRLILGYQLFWKAAPVYKLIGIPYINVEEYLRSGEVALSMYGLNLNISYLGFVNAIGNCLLVYGVFGLLLYLKLFHNIWKESNTYSKCYVLICFIGIFGQSVFWNGFFLMQFAVMLNQLEGKSFVKVILGQGVGRIQYES